MKISIFQKPGISWRIELFLDYRASPRVHFLPNMRRIPLYFICAGLELARYFSLVQAAGYFAAATPSAPQVLRLVASPNALFAVAFFFLGFNGDRYDSYRPLLIVGKLVVLFSGVMALPRLFGLGGSPEPSMTATFTILGVAVWDAVSVAILWFKRRPTPAGGVKSADGQPTAGEPELVELD